MIWFSLYIAIGMAASWFYLKKIDALADKPKKDMNEIEREIDHDMSVLPPDLLRCLFAGIMVIGWMPLMVWAIIETAVEGLKGRL